MTTPTFDPSALFSGAGDTLLADVSGVAPIAVPVFVGLLGLGIVLKVIKRVARG